MPIANCRMWEKPLLHSAIGNRHSAISLIAAYLPFRTLPEEPARILVKDLAGFLLVVSSTAVFEEGVDQHVGV